MAKSNKGVKKSSVKKMVFSSDMRFIVPMPGKATWNRQSTQFVLKRFHQNACNSSDLAIEDYRIQLLMEREYPID